MSHVHFILDEMASLDHLAAIDDAVDKYRGYGVRLLCLVQSVAQLRKCFPDGQEQTLLSNCTQIFFGVNDQQTAELVSARLGEETITVDSGGVARSASNNWSNAPQGNSSGGYSDSRNSNWQRQARRLLKPDEVISLNPRTAVTFTPGIPPICTTLLRYYEEKTLARPIGLTRRTLSACLLFAASAIVCAASIAMAAILTLEVTKNAKATRPPVQITRRIGIADAQ
jgi:type IV secretion system protein VirD4